MPSSSSSSSSSPWCHASRPSCVCVPGDMVTSSSSSCTSYSTKIGGRPSFSDDPSSLSDLVMSDSRDAPASLLEPLCSLCSSPLALVLQGYAPVQQCARRLLLVYTCVTPACASANKGAGVWKAVRWQKSDGNDAKQKPEFSSSTQHDESASWEEDASTTVPPGNESWGGDDGNFFGANDDDASWGGGGGGGGGEQTEEDWGALATEFQKQATIAETQPAQHITTTTQQQQQPPKQPRQGRATSTAYATSKVTRR
ncbi:PDCD2_C domain-containing protein [Pycnococcus provasolii]